MTESQTRHEAFAVLKIRDFRWLVLGRLLGTIGIQIQGMAVGWQIYELTKNPLWLGMIGLAEVLPAIAVSLYAGHLADVVRGAVEESGRRLAAACWCCKNFRRWRIMRSSNN
jgi:hypothetical protein